MNDDLLARAKEAASYHRMRRDPSPTADILDALVARCEQAEADADRLAGRLRKKADLYPADHEALRLHDEAVVHQ